MTDQESTFSTLKTLSYKTTVFASIERVLQWDQETYMPAGSIEVRSSQIELLSTFIHKQKRSPTFKKALSQLINLQTGEILEKEAPLYIQSAASLWYKEWKQSSKLPTSFIKKEAKTSSDAVHAWSLAKKNADFSYFLPHLEAMVSLAKRKATLLGYKEHPYDALLDLFEPEMTVAKLTPLFEELKKALSSLLQEVQQGKNEKPFTLPSTFDPLIQMQLGKDLLKLLGFSEETSRLDLTSHPFCMGIHPLDTRMTTRIFKDNPLSHILSVLHEAGHGLYNAGLPRKHYGTPLCEPLSFGVDESQSRLWETMIGRGLPFWTFFYPELQKAFPQELGTIPLTIFYKAINEIKPSFIRVEADEITYCLHVILRFEMEKSLIEGSLEVKDIPHAWNTKMQELLGITPSHDGEGCLQDIHWSMGYFGYFPTYALGNLLAAQLYHTIKASHPDLLNEIEKGNMKTLRNWLQENIHQHGKLYKTEELIQKATGTSLSPLPYIQYLQTKYRALYLQKA